MSGVNPYISKPHMRKISNIAVENEVSTNRYIDIDNQTMNISTINPISLLCYTNCY